MVMGSLNMQGIRASSALVALGSFLVAIGTFLGRAGLDPRNPLFLFLIIFIFNAGLLLIYVLLQTFLITTTVGDRWALGMSKGLSFVNLL